MSLPIAAPTRRHGRRHTPRRPSALRLIFLTAPPCVVALCAMLLAWLAAAAPVRAEEEKAKDDGKVVELTVDAIQGVAAGAVEAKAEKADGAEAKATDEDAEEEEDEEEGEDEEKEAEQEDVIQANAQPTGFAVRKEDVKVIDQIADFNRYVEKSAWELAFRTISTLAEQDLQGMVPSKDGFLVPTRQRIWESLAALPPAGREAYRLFYDAAARQLYNQVAQPAEGGMPPAGAGAGAPNTTGPVDEIAILRQVFDRYFVTSVGDEAADRLGDAYFEAGDFIAAASTWEAILNHAPDTDLSALKLHIKRCLALARAGRWEKFDQAAETIRQRFSGQAVTVGGREVPADEFLTTLAKSRPDASTQPATTVVTDPLPPAQSAFDLPKEPTPAWKVEFMDETLHNKLRAALTNSGWGDMGELGSLVPQSASDGKRVYGNWLGVCFAIDGNNGKLLWRTRKFSELGDKFQEFVNYQVNTDRYTLTLVGDRLLVTGINLDRLTSGEDSARLVCLGAEDGQLKWSSNSTSVGQWGIIGRPLVVGKTLYVTGVQQGNQEMHLLAVNMDNGELLWNGLLGTPQAPQDYRGRSTAPAPTLAHHAGMIYVLTNNGALLAFNAATRKVEWAFTCDIPRGVENDGSWNWMMMQMANMRKQGPGSIIILGGTLYIKESGSGALYAIDLTGPSLLWRRPVQESATVAKIDDRFVYLLGADLDAIDLQSRKMVWSTRLPLETGKLRPIVTERSLYVFSSRGVFQYDLSNGDPVIPPGGQMFRGVDLNSVGGTLWRTPDRMVCVSNLAVTAYPLTPEGGAQPAGEAQPAAANAAPVDAGTVAPPPAPAGAN